MLLGKAASPDTKKKNASKTALAGGAKKAVAAEAINPDGISDIKKAIEVCMQWINNEKCN